MRRKTREAIVDGMIRLGLESQKDLVSRLPDPPASNAISKWLKEGVPKTRIRDLAEALEIPETKLRDDLTWDDVTEFLDEHGLALVKRHSGESICPTCQGRRFVPCGCCAGSGLAEPERGNAG